MRTLFGLLLLFTSLVGVAQPAYAGKNWQVAFSVGGNIIRGGYGYPGISAADTLNALECARSFDFRPLDTLVTDQGPVVYYSRRCDVDEISYRNSRLVAPRLMLGVHRRFTSGMELGLSAAYARWTSQFVPDENGILAADYVFYQQEMQSWRADFLVDVVYNFRKTKRLQPYAGLSFNFGIIESTLLGSNFVYPARNVVREAPPIAPRFRVQTLFDLDTRIVGGINYWVAECWQIGLMLTTDTNFVFVPRRLQLRYVLGKKDKTDSPR